MSLGELNLSRDYLIASDWDHSQYFLSWELAHSCHLVLPAMTTILRNVLQGFMRHTTYPELRDYMDIPLPHIPKPPGVPIGAPQSDTVRCLSTQSALEYIDPAGRLRYHLITAPATGLAERDTRVEDFRLLDGMFRGVHNLLELFLPWIHEDGLPRGCSPWLAWHYVHRMTQWL